MLKHIERYNTIHTNNSNIHIYSDRCYRPTESFMYEQQSSGTWLQFELKWQTLYNTVLRYIYIYIIIPQPCNAIQKLINRMWYQLNHRLIKFEYCPNRTTLLCNMHYTLYYTFEIAAEHFLVLDLQSSELNGIPRYVSINY